MARSLCDHSKGPTVLTQIMENSLAATVQSKSCRLWLCRNFAAACDWTAKPPAVAFGTKAGLRAPPDPRKGCQSTAGCYKTQQQNTDYQNNRSATTSCRRFSTTRTFATSATTCRLPSASWAAHMAISAWHRPETMAAFASNTARRFGTFRYRALQGSTGARTPSWPTCAAGRDERAAVRVPIAFILPDAGTPGVATLVQASSGARSGPAWGAEPVRTALRRAAAPVAAQSHDRARSVPDQRAPHCAGTRGHDRVLRHDCGARRHDGVGR